MGKAVEGGAITDESTIFLNSQMIYTPSRLASTMMHEASHIVCYRLGYWRVYHTTYMPEELTDDALRIYIATAWEAERYVDQMAKELMKEVFPDLYYWNSYGNRPETKKWFDKEELGPYKKELRRRKLRNIDRQQAKKRKVKQ